jgi:hypothetical protein
MSGDVAGGVVVGILGTAVGVVAVDYVFSPPGESWVSKLTGGLTGAHPSLLSAQVSPPMSTHAHASSDVSHPGSFHSSVPSGVTQVGPITPSSRPLPVGPAPLTVTPELVNRIVVALNRQMHVNLPSSGMVTEDVKRALVSIQTQLGITPTGFPDQKTLAALGVSHGHDAQRASQIAVRKVSKAAPVTDAGNFISKTFGGPPSTRMTGPDEGVRKTQHLLNTFFGRKVVDEDGLMGSPLSSLIKKFQEMQGLKATGILDSKTQNLINNLDFSAAHKVRTGAPTSNSGVSTWKSESQSLGQAAQDVIAHAMTEGKPQRLATLSKLLKTAGFPVTATAVATSHGGSSVASGWW